MNRRAALSLAAAAMLASPPAARSDDSTSSLTFAVAAESQAGSDASSNPLIQGAMLEDFRIRASHRLVFQLSAEFLCA